MITQLPFWINLLFIVTVVIGIVLFHLSNNRPTRLTLVIVVWAVLHSALAFSGFYLNTEATPPRFGFVLIPAFLLIGYSLLPKQRAWIVKNRNTKLSTFVHTLRIFAEIVLLQLFIHKMVPELMTFEGRNFDILAGITAPVFGLLYVKNKISKKAILTWNVLGLFLISFILLNGILSSELPFQQFGFEQPNRGMMYFPFILLPAVLVPIVLWTHLTDIFKLRVEIQEESRAKKL